MERVCLSVCQQYYVITYVTIRLIIYIIFSMIIKKIYHYLILISILFINDISIKFWVRFKKSIWSKNNKSCDMCYISLKNEGYLVYGTDNLLSGFNKT